MNIIDNQAFLLEAIRKHVQHEKAGKDKEQAALFSQKKAAHDKTVALALERKEKQHEAALKAEAHQQASSFALKEKQLGLQARSNVYEAVLAEVRAQLSSNATKRKQVVKAMMKAVATGRTIKQFHVPKQSVPSSAKIKADQHEFIVIGKINSYEQVELTLDEVLTQNSGLLQELINKEVTW